MRAVVVSFPGSNREPDVIRALTQAAGRAPVTVWHRETELPPADLVVLPGGFSHGDYLRAGAMAARSPVMTAVKATAARGTRVLGICNGFQILVEAGMLPGALLSNAGLKFVCRWIGLRVETAASDFTRGYAEGQILRVPAAHHDGNYVADGETLRRLEGDGRVAFRYVGADGAAAPTANPNGSVNNIAGILSQDGRVLGLMPHPEDAVEPAQGSADGAGLFRGLVEALA